MYVHAGFSAIQKWVDDFLVIHFPHQHWSEQDFTELTSTVGVPWSHKKTRPLSTCQRYIGFLWDLRARTVALPKEKVDVALKLVQEWSVASQHFSEHNTMSLHGRLIHIFLHFQADQVFPLFTSPLCPHFPYTQSQACPPPGPSSPTCPGYGSSYQFPPPPCPLPAKPPSTSGGGETPAPPSESGSL